MSTLGSFSEILKALNINENQIPSESDWNLFIARVSIIVDQALQRSKQYEELLQIGYNEMQHWSEMVDQRELIIKSILNSSTDLIITLDGQGHIIEFNHSAERLSGYEKSKVQGTSIFDLIPAGNFERFLRKNITLSDSSSPDYSLRNNKIIKFHHHDEFQANIYFSRINVNESTIYSIYIRDLTEEILAKTELDKSRGQATQAAKMASLGEMAGGIAHEINTPLGVILMNAEIIRDESHTTSPDQHLMLQASESIENTALKISKIITGLRKFSRDDTSDSMEQIDLAPVIEDAISLCKQRFQSHGINLMTDPIPQGWTFYGRPVGLTQVILNLLNNAHDAIEELEEKWVHLDFNDNDDYYFIRVSDSGHGIPKDVREKIMNPFFTTKPIGKGTGLGLSISRGIIESQRGSLFYDEECPNTRFIIKLPKHQS